MLFEGDTLDHLECVRFYGFYLASCDADMWML